MILSNFRKPDALTQEPKKDLLTRLKSLFYTYSLLSLGTLLIVVGVYFFKFPNNFTFGGVTGIAVSLAAWLPYSPSSISLVLNLLLLVVGFIFLGKGFGFKTVYCSLLLSFGLWLLQRYYPLSKPLTNQPVIEFFYAIALPAVGAAILFYLGASGGGTDIIAMIFKKHRAIHVGKGLLVVDFLITLTAVLVFDITTVLFSFAGLFMKSIVIDNLIESLGSRKNLQIVCKDPEPICTFIINALNRSATVIEAQGAYSKKPRYVVLTALKPKQALALRRYIQKTDPEAFITMSKTSEIFGKGFLSF